MKSLMRLFIQLNNWLIQNMNKFYLWLALVLITLSGIDYYQVNHPMNTITSIIIFMFLSYTEFKIIFR